MIKTAIKKWGNSLAIRIPQNIANKFNLYDGNEVFFNVGDNSLILDIPKSKTTKNDWKSFLITTKNNHKKENDSENIDHILYGA